MENMLKQILSEITGMKSEIQEVKNELKSEIQEVKNELKSEIQDVKSSTNNRFDTIEAKLSLLQQDSNEIKNKLNIVESQTALISEMQSPIHDLEKKLRDHDADIRLIKRVMSN